MSERHERRGHFVDARILIGVAILIAGVAMLLSRMGVISYGIDLWDFWPVLLILLGFSKVFQPRQYRETIFGIFVIIIGSLLLANNLEILDFGWDDFWPMLLIFLGLVILRNGIFGPRRRHDEVEGDDSSHFGKVRPVDADYIDVSAVLGGGTYRYSSKKLAGAKASAIMGGCELDLREADIEGDTLVMDVFAMMGGVEMQIPETWTIILEATPILGGVEDHTRKPAKDDKKIVIRGSVIMGGIEIKN